MSKRSSGQRLHVVGNVEETETEETQGPIVLPARIVVGGNFEAIFTEYHVTFLQGTGTTRLSLEEAIGLGMFAQGLLENMAKPAQIAETTEQAEG